ncbi:unnamed protein product, partial [Brenthis ino]
MLCGAIWSAAPVSLRGLAPHVPPRPALLAALVMHALHADDSSFVGKMGFSNPPKAPKLHDQTTKYNSTV